ncbi:hypothetical protein STEG23_003368, partial [Scotinomys teguina]
MAGLERSVYGFAYMTHPLLITVYMPLSLASLMKPNLPKAYPYCSIKHEHPYDIIMRHIQTTISRRRRWKSRNHTAFLALPGLYVKQPDIQGRFILKPRDPARSQKMSNTEESAVKRKQPFISLLFHKGFVPHQDQVCTALPVVKTGKLTGKDLTAICEDGNLLTAILDILSFISERGPITEGVFRSPGKIRPFLALKERLDYGTDVNSNNESVPAVASILKESSNRRNDPEDTVDTEKLCSDTILYAFLPSVSPGNGLEKRGLFCRKSTQLCPVSDANPLEWLTQLT